VPTEQIPVEFDPYGVGSIISGEHPDVSKLVEENKAVR